MHDHPPLSPCDGCGTEAAGTYCDPCRDAIQEDRHERAVLTAQERDAQGWR